MSRPPDDRAPHARAPRRLYGRRKAHALRPGQRRAMDELLPRLRIDLPAPGRRLDPAALFQPPPRSIWLEIGFGAGEHLVAQALQHADVGFIGAEVFQDGVAKLLRKVEESDLRNVRVYHGDARDLLDCLPAASIERAFVLFPDPWPKTRHHKRRFIQRRQLDMLARVLADGGELRLASDDPGYQRWMLIELSRHEAFAWTARRAGDWRERGGDWPATRYETKALSQGRRPVYLRYRRRRRQG